MIYFEFNHKGGKGKYSQMTEKAYQQAIKQNDRWFLISAEDGYALECTQAEHHDYYSRLNHEKNSRRGKDGKYPELLSIERNEVECSSDMSVFFDGDNPTIDDIVLDGLETAERNALLHKAMNRNNYSSSTTIIAMITSQEKKKMPVHVKLDNPNLKHNSCVLLEQVRTVSVDRLEKYICTLDESEMTRINRALKISLAV